MNSDIHTAALILVMSLVTAGIRFLPFAVFSGKRELPSSAAYLGKVLPAAVLGMLVVYCLKDISFTVSPYALPELASCAVVIAVQCIKKNTVLSVIAGTAFYMIITNLI